MIPQEDSTTPAPFFPTFAPSTSALPVIHLTEEPRRQEQPRKLEFLPLADTDNDLESEEVILGNLAEVELPSLPVTSPPAPVRSRGRPARPLPSRNFTRQRPDSVQLGRSRTPPPAPPTSPRTTPEALFQTSFQEPEQISLTPRPRPRAPLPPARPQPQPPRRKVVSPQDLAAALISAPQPASRQRGRGSSSSSSTSSSLPSSIVSSQPEYEYEYYYEYLDDEEDRGHVADYDLVPLANKVGH